MNKVILKENDLEFLLRWRDAHKDLVRLSVNPVHAIRIECVDSGYAITGIRNDRRLDLVVNKSGRSWGKVSFEIMENGFCRLIEDKAKLREEDRQAVLTVYCSVIAFMVFGNETIEYADVYEPTTNADKKPTKKSAKKARQKGYTYILDHSGKAVRMKIQGSHASPKGMFSVRGHYRHYRNGKVVWVAEYTKGTGQKKGKKYKIGNHEKAIDKLCS